MGSTPSTTVKEQNIEKRGPKEYPHNLQRVRRKEFSRMKDHVYLDFTGSSLYSTEQIEKYSSDLADHLYGNPHSANPSSNLMSTEVDKVRDLVLELFNVTSNEYEVIFTSGATAALRLLSQTFQWSEFSKYAYLEDNHTSVVGIREMASAGGAESYCLRFPKNLNLMKDLKAYPPSLVHPGRITEKANENTIENETVNHLFAYPAQSNFSGKKYPLDWIKMVHEKGVESVKNGVTSSRWYVLLDAAAFVPSTPLNLFDHSPDFVCLSFYKIFGFPTGIGALLVRKGTPLHKDTYFAGGTTEVYLPSENFRVLKPTLHEQYEEGTIGFLDILALKYGLETVQRISGSMQCIQTHTFSLIQRLHQEMLKMYHSNGNEAIKIYSFSNYDDPNGQGAVIAFNVMKADGSYVGYNTVVEFASREKIHLRGGCFCNVGSCNTLLKIGDSRIKQIHKAGYKCGAVDLVDGLPVGAVRASLGYISMQDDVDKFVKFLRRKFVK